LGGEKQGMLDGGATKKSAGLTVALGSEKGTYLKSWAKKEEEERCDDAWNSGPYTRVESSFGRREKTSAWETAVSKKRRRVGGRKSEPNPMC